MSDLTPEQQYKKEYDAAMIELEATAAGTKPAATTAPAAEPEKVAEAEPAKVEEAAIVAEPVETLEDIKARLAKAEKALKDTQAWGTKNAQRLAEIERERTQQQREASKPAILDVQPELIEAIRYVANDPAPQQAAAAEQDKWFSTIDAAHPGIFGKDIDPELEAALVAKRDASDGAWNDPLVAIRDITAEKIAFAERAVGKRFAVESAKQAAKSAMSVPGAGGGTARTAPDPALDELKRIQNMSDADFEREVRRVKGY